MTNTTNTTPKITTLANNDSIHSHKVFNHGKELNVTIVRLFSGNQGSGYVVVLKSGKHAFFGTIAQCRRWVGQAVYRANARRAS
jgi:hypothetical protein